MNWEDVPNARVEGDRIYLDAPPDVKLELRNRAEESRLKAVAELRASESAYGQVLPKVHALRAQVWATLYAADVEAAK